MQLIYTIIGAGGIGGYYGGRLANAGHEVHFLLHSDYQHVVENGLRVDSVSGNFHLEKVNAHASTQTMPKADVILVGLKTTNNHLIKDLVAPILKENTIILLIQNGLGIEEKLHNDLPQAQIAGGLAFICSEKIAPGHISHMDYGKLIIGSYNVQNAEELQQVCTDLQNTGVEVELSADLNTSRWQKLIWNVPFNGLTVALNTSTDTLITNPASRQLVYDMMLEVIRAGRACGAKLKDEQADGMIQLTERMKPYAPSMKVDYDHKRPLEINAIYTQTIAQAAKNGFAMSKVEMLEKQLHFLEAFNQA